MTEPYNFYYGDAVLKLREMDEEKMTEATVMLQSLNINEKTNLPQIHISGIDGEDVEEATQLVFHKMADGTLFVEWYTKNEHAKNGVTPYQTVNIDKVGKEKLIEFFKNEITY